MLEGRCYEAEASGASPSLKNWLDLLIYGNLRGRFHLPEVSSASLCPAVPWRGRAVWLPQGSSQGKLFTDSFMLKTLSSKCP